MTILKRNRFHLAGVAACFVACLLFPAVLYQGLLRDAEMGTLSCYIGTILLLAPYGIGIVLCVQQGIPCLDRIEITGESVRVLRWGRALQEISWESVQEMGVLRHPDSPQWYAMLYIAQHKLTGAERVQTIPGIFSAAPKDVLCFLCLYRDSRTGTRTRELAFPAEFAAQMEGVWDVGLLQTLAKYPCIYIQRGAGPTYVPMEELRQDHRRAAKMSRFLLLLLLWCIATVAGIHLLFG